MQDEPIEITLGSRFDYIAETYPDHTAVICDGKVTTYNELRMKVSTLCGALLHCGIAENSRVGILCERSLELVTAMIAIVKIGATYVPLAIDDPLSRIAHLVNDVQVELVLTDQDHTLSFVPTMDLKDISMDKCDIEDGQRVVGDSLAYIMFTSGTTGKPKGVGVSHDNILNLTVGSDYVRLNSNTRILQTGALTFDASTFEVWGALLNGGGLIIPSKHGLTDFEYIQQTVQEYGVTTMWLTAPLFHIAAEQNPRMFDGICELIVGGDVVNPSSVNKVLDVCRDICIWNGYGPTECTTFSTVYPITYRENREPIPIGKPIKNVVAYILDVNYSPVKQGEIGELYIGGKGVTIGYVNRPELNEEVFIDNPFGDGKLYKSGDSVSEDATGNLHYWGRKDRQVKIRGYRIELVSIESLLETIDEIVSAAVCVVTNKVGGKEICSYVKVRENREISQDEIRQKFSQIGPSHVILTHIMVTNSMPLNKNGKIDYGKITSSFECKLTMNEEVNHRSSMDRHKLSDEALLTELISKQIGFNITDITTSFFDLGIDSLMAVYLARDINNEFGTKINAIDILANPTILEMMTVLGSVPTNQSGTHKVRSVEKKLPILNQQKPFFVDYQLNPDSVRYNVPLLIQLSHDISIPRLTDTLHKIVLRHDALRVQFTMTGSEIFQKIVDEPIYTIPLLEGRPNLKELIRPFNLSEGLPFRFVIINDVDCAWLFMDFHHITVDGASLSVIVHDLNLLYGGHQLAKLNDNFATVVEESNTEFLKNRSESIAYWQEYLQHYRGMNELPIDKQDDSGISQRSNTFRFQINEERTSALRAWSQKNNMTLFESLLLAYACTLHAVTASSEVMFATPSRDYSILTSEPIVAMLTNTLWVLSEVKKDESITDYMNAFIGNLRESQKCQNVPFEEIYDRINPGSRSAVIDTLIAYHTVKDMNTELFGMPVSLKPITPDEGMFSLNLQIYDCTTHLELDWEYLADLFEYETMSNICDIFSVMLNLLTQQETLSTRNMSDVVTTCVQMI
ncbi:amino acid adenylation domain-containing protein [Paenibacillus wynnii]|uniref:amino acid adenylation domain-containing protein n=1 Tax=Paenibacillus wynnii TaxID=268407 RepID=UPI00278CAD00|nr:amino acid adenylation domain-containing protein [Paenibacillus wynnii]MDQ0195347.1 amino acid adenylation domain-containing protein [Paenibacillus wynnii]